MRKWISLMWWWIAVQFLAAARRSHEPTYRELMFEVFGKEYRNMEQSTGAGYQLSVAQARHLARFLEAQRQEPDTIRVELVEPEEPGS